MNIILEHISEIAIIGIGMLIRAIEKRWIKKKDEDKRAGRD